MANENINVNVTVNVASATPNTTESKIPVQGQTPTAYYPIADGDYDTIKFYEGNGYAVRHINVRDKMHWYVLLPVPTQAEADKLNTAFDTLRRQEAREYARRCGNEVSYDQMVDDGYNPASEDNDLADIVSDLIITEVLMDELQKLSDEKKRICHAVMNGQSDYKVAEELHLARTTYRDHKARTLDELADLLKKFK